MFEYLNEYSLWLEPFCPETSRKRKQIQGVVSEFASKAGVDSFVPHVTLLGAIPYDPEKIRGQITELLQNTTQFEIRFRCLSTGDNPLKCFFLECSENQKLAALNRKAQEIFGTNKEFLPHMSLVYGNITEELKIQFRTRVETLGLDYFSFQTRSVTLWHALGSPGKWKRL